MSSICTDSGVHLVRKYILCTFSQLGWAKSWDSSNNAVIWRAPLLDHYGAFYFVLLFNNDVFHLLQLLKFSWPVKHTFIITSCAISTAKDRQIRKKYSLILLNLMWSNLFNVIRKKINNTIYSLKEIHKKIKFVWKKEEERIAHQKETPPPKCLSIFLVFSLQ